MPSNEKTEAQLIQEQLDRDSRAENAHKTCRYRWNDGKVESKIFDHPDDIPAAAGWVDSPAKCNDADPPPRVEAARPTLVVDDSVYPEDADPDGVSMKDLRARYAEVSGRKVPVGVKKTDVQQMIRDA